MLLCYWICASQCASGTLEHPLIQEDFLSIAAGLQDQLLVILSFLQRAGTALGWIGKILLFKVQRLYSNSCHCSLCQVTLGELAEFKRVSCLQKIQINQK